MTFNTLVAFTALCFGILVGLTVAWIDRLLIARQIKRELARETPAKKN